MFNYFPANKLISQNQSSFQPSDSCINPLLSNTHTIFIFFYNGLEVISAFLGISKTFDKVYREGLVFKLKRNNISVELLHILPDFVGNGEKVLWGSA